jgi:hypothetical protein
MENTVMHEPGGRSELEQSSPGAAVSGISLTLCTPADNQQLYLPDVPPDATPSAILDQLVTEGYLPRLPAGQGYELAVSGGYRIGENEQLGAAGVPNGATLRILTTTPGAAATTYA